MMRVSDKYWMLYKSIQFPDADLVADIIAPKLPEEYYKVGGFRSHSPSLFEKCTPLVRGVLNYTDWSNVTNVAIISVTPGKGMPVHIDDGVEQNPFALNLPIFNCTDETYTVFYKIKDNVLPKNQTREDTFGSTYNEWNDSDVEEIDRFCFTEPGFFNTQVPHSVHNTGTVQRLALSLRFNVKFNF